MVGTHTPEWLGSTPCPAHLRQLAGDGGRLRDVVRVGGLCWADCSDAGQLWRPWGRGDGQVEGSHRQDELQTVLDPEIATTVLPVLKAREEREGGREGEEQKVGGKGREIEREREGRREGRRGEGKTNIHVHVLYVQITCNGYDEPNTKSQNNTTTMY